MKPKTIAFVQLCFLIDGEQLAGRYLTFLFRNTFYLQILIQNPTNANHSQVDRIV